MKRVSNHCHLPLLGLKNKGKGTVTNNNGEFGLKITPDLFNDTLSVSYLGYIRKEIPVRQAFQDDLSILDEEGIHLNP